MTARTAVLAAGLLLLGGCLDIEEVSDQGAHFAAGYAMACDLSRWATPEQAVAAVMDYARERENLQHPGQCHAGCRYDLEFWQAGAEAGAVCPASESAEMPE